jgi:hypothetical protein
MSERDPDSNLSVYILVGFLIIVLVSAIPVVAAERTVLDADHAVETMDEENVSAKTTVAFQEKLTATIREALAEDPSVDQASDPLLTDDQIQDIAATSITESYVDAELNGHFERTYEYINGDRGDVALVFDLSEPKAQAIAEADAMEREARAERGPGVTNPEAVPDDRLVIGSHLAEEFPDEQNITSGGTPPGEIETAAASSGIFDILVWLLPALAVVLVGLLYYVTRSAHRTGEAAGAAFVAAGVLGLLGSFGGGPVARSLTEGRLTLENPEFAALSDGVVAMVGDLFELITLQSGAIVALGLVVLAVVYASEHGYFDAVRGNDSSPQRRERTSQDDREQIRESQSRPTDTRQHYDGEEASRAEREYDTGDGQPVTGPEPSGAQTDQRPAETDHSVAGADRSDTDQSVTGTDRQSTADDRATSVEESGDAVDDSSAAGTAGDNTGESQEYDPDLYDEHGFKRGTDPDSDG